METIIAVDFDGTIVDHVYPDIGVSIPGSIESLREFNRVDFKIILYTMRSGPYLDEAVQFLKNFRIELYDVNRNPNQYTWTLSPKVYANYYIDDAAIGCPLIKITGFHRPCVDWQRVMAEISKRFPSKEFKIPYINHAIRLRYYNSTILI